MIPKFLQRKSRSFRQLIQYVLREQATPIVLIRHNIEGDTPEAWVRAFQQNEDDRKRKRKNNVKVLHIVLSWHGNDDLSTNAMRDMCKHFMMQYNPHAMYIAIAHIPDQEQKHPHVHIIAGGVDRFGRSMRLSKKAFRELKQEAERYQRERYPELIHSEVEHGKSRTARQKEYELPLRRKWNKSKLENHVKEILQQAFQAAQSLDDFYDRIQAAGLTTYTRGGKIVGVWNGKYKFRFRLFGLKEEQLRELGKNEHTRHKFDRELGRN